MLETISARNDERARDVLSYFIDLNKCLREIDRLMVPDGKVCIVIGIEASADIEYLLDRLFENLALNWVLSMSQPMRETYR